ncbi:MAG TPA: thiopeptide-type bacteriocin biosynthesis protein [Myxococcaceae bacterium]|nr:thiopeptide-type bacteriocin biosynthesis protein [Myxococcaceae bacterium]
MTSPWTSLHIFFHADALATDRFLVEGVLPAVSGLARQGGLQSWFFIRYWEGGPHIRLRLRGCTPEGVKQVEEALTGYLQKQPALPQPLQAREYYRTFTSDSDPVATYGWHTDRTIVPIAYVPELDRYGGEEGMAVSEELFSGSSQVALALVRTVPEHGKRMVVLVDLLLAMLEGMGLSRLEAVDWLRSTVNAWPRFFLISQAQVVERCQLAEKDFLSKQPVWMERLPKVRKSLEAGGAQPSLFAVWAQQVRGAMQRYRELESQAKLTMKPVDILRSQLHMLHNRLGLTIPEECHVAWLASLILAGTDPALPGTVDGAEASDRRFHEQSKLSRHVRAQMGPADTEFSDEPPAPLRWPGREPVALPAQGPERLQLSLGEALLARRSRYGGYGGTVALEELATLLQLSAGYVRTMEVPRPQQPLKVRLRAYPSAGARYPLRTYVLARRVTGLEPGLYRYDDLAHALQWVAPAPDAALIRSCSPFLQQEAQPAIDATDAPLWLFTTADLTYQRERYGPRALRLVLLECGHLAQNLCLAATAMNLSCITVGGFYDDLLNQVLYLDGVNQAVFYMLPVGRR